MKNAPTKAQRGLTLIEVIIALFVLLVGLVSTIVVFMMATRANTLAQQIANGTTASLDKMEQLRNLDFDTDPSIQPGGDLENNAPNYSDLYTAGAFTYGRRWQVFDTTGALPNQAPTPATRVVLVRVLPASTLPGTSKIVELRTVMVDRVD